MIDSLIYTEISDVVSRHFSQTMGPGFLEIPANSANGDYATNIAFKLAKTLKKSPMIIAAELSSLLNQDLSHRNIKFSDLNGFINIKLSDQAVFEFVSAPFAGYSIPPKTINLEFVSANPTGPLHIGHGRWAVIGSTLATLLKEIGYTVTSEFYINDAGSQIENFRKSIAAVKAGLPVPENGYHGAYIADLANTDEDPVTTMTSDHKQVLSSIGVEFDIWYSESSLHKAGLVDAMLSRIEKMGLSYVSEGATWFKTTDFGDSKDRVLVKADGDYTYFSVDIAYHCEKIAREYDILIDIWGADHHGYVPRMSAALQGVFGANYKAGDRFQVIIGQLVSLFRNGEPVRMSKRTGEMITLSEVIEEIGADATRFFLIQKSHDTALDFDLSVATSRSSENPVYYIQYAHARISSILKKSEEVISENINAGQGGLDPAERDLLLMILRYRREVLNAATNKLPHQLANYLILLSKQFHSFYHNCPILSSESKVKARRLTILFYTQKTIQSGLALLGISAPESM